MKLKDKLETVYKYMPGDLGDIAMMIPCHINTLRKIRKGGENVNPVYIRRIDELYEKAIAIKEISDGA